MIKYNLTTADTQEKISGFDNLDISNVDKLINGTIDFIVCEILDKLEYIDRLKTINTIFKKLSFGGEVTFKFFNAYQLCKSVIKGDMTSKSLSEIVNNLNSLFVESDMMDLVNQTDNIRIVKIYNNNNHIIINIKKTND